jgi:hypothetical protein
MWLLTGIDFVCKCTDVLLVSGVSAATRFAQKVQPMSGSRPVIASSRDNSHLGSAHAAVAATVDAIAG